MTKPKSLDDAKLLVEAGKAIVGIATYCIQGSTPQNTDLKENARNALLNLYLSSTIKKYFKILIDHELHVEAVSLEGCYQRLRRTAGLKPIKF